MPENVQARADCSPYSLTGYNLKEGGNEDNALQRLRLVHVFCSLMYAEKYVVLTQELFHLGSPALFSLGSYANASRLLLSERVFPLIPSESCCQTCFMLRAAHAHRPGYQGKNGQKRSMESLTKFPGPPLPHPPSHTLPSSALIGFVFHKQVFVQQQNKLPSGSFPL